MTGTFKFDPKTETFVFRVDGKAASVSWNKGTRRFEIWKTTEEQKPEKVGTSGGLFRALTAVWRAVQEKGSGL